MEVVEVFVEVDSISCVSCGAGERKHEVRDGSCLRVHNTKAAGLGWEICLEFRGIPRLFQFWTFWTPEFSSEFYFSDRKMCSLQFRTRFFRFGIPSRH